MVLLDERALPEHTDGTVRARGSSKTIAHALSLDPGATWRPLAFLAAFATFLLGTARAIDHDDAQRIVRGIIVIGVVLQVLELLAEGKRTKEVAAMLGVTADTANAHIKNIYSKFTVHGRAAVVSEAIRRGFIRSERSPLSCSRRGNRAWHYHYR